MVEQAPGQLAASCRRLSSWLRSSVRHSRLIQQRTEPSVHWLLAAIGLAVALGACQRKAGAELLQVSAVVPGEVQFGDVIQIVGDGFALGSRATVTFDGAVHQAGRPPRPVDISLTAETLSQRELSVTLPRSAQTDFCGEPEAAAHGTFRGDVEVAIAAKTAGAPPVTGTLHGAVLELYPATRARAREEQQIADGRRALEFFGLEVAAEDRPGLTVVRLAPGSRAVVAELSPGDRILSAAGVTVLQPSDLVPDAARMLEVVVERGASERTLLLEADGFVPRPPRSLSGAAIVVVAAALGLVLWTSPLGRAATWLLGNWVDLARPKVASRGCRSARPRGATWSTPGVSSVLVWLVLAAAQLSPVLRPGPIDLPLGLLAILLVASTLVLVAALLRGGSSAEGWLLAPGVRAACRQCVILAPAWIALSSTWASLRGEVFEPALDHPIWTGTALGHPLALALVLLLLLSALPRLAPRSAGVLEHARPSAGGGRVRQADAVGAIYLCSACAVGASVFIGAGLGPTASGALGASSGLSLSLLQLGTYTTLAVIAGILRRLCLDLTPEQWLPIVARVCLPISICAVVLAHGWRALDALPPLWRWVAAVYGPACTLALASGGALLVWRVIWAARRPAQASLTPWS